MATDYILGESKGETERLLAQAAHDPAIDRLRFGGLARGQVVVDAGCGPGLITHHIAQAVGSSGRVVGFDLSEERLAAARARPASPDAAPIEFRRGSVTDPPVEPGSADLVWCQYVIEYLPRPMEAIRALVGLLKPGGRLVVSDVDGMGLFHHPLPEALAADLERFRAMLAQTGFDPFVGRKLHAYFREAGLSEVDAIVQPCVTIAGRAPAAERAAWVQRFEAMRPLGNDAFGGPSRYSEFTGAFLAHLDDPGSFTYWVVVVASGRLR